MATIEQHICAELVPIFSHLNHNSLLKISALTHHEKITKGQQVISPTAQKRLVILASGSIKVYQLSAAGKEQLLRIMEPGALKVRSCSLRIRRNKYMVRHSKTV